MLQEILNQWSIDYDIDPAHMEGEYGQILTNTLGYCEPKYTPTVQPDGQYGRRAYIRINELLKDHPLASKAVLWHEFCHGEKWIKDGNTDGHGKAWFGRCWRKPVLTLLDWLYAKPLFLIIRSKK